MAYNPPIGSIYHLYTTYSPCLLGGEKCYRSHLLGEPFQQPLTSLQNLEGTIPITINSETIPRELDENYSALLILKIAQYFLSFFVFKFTSQRKPSLQVHGKGLSTPNPSRFKDMPGGQSSNPPGCMVFFFG